MNNLEARLFDINDHILWKEHLSKEGYVVIKNILSDDLIDEVINDFITDWNTVTPEFDIKNKKTWNPTISPMSWYNGMI